MRDEHREELDPRDELVIAAEAGVELAPVDHISIREVAETLEGNGRSFHLLEERLELLALALGDPALRVHSEPRMAPRTQ